MLGAPARSVISGASRLQAVPWPWSNGHASPRERQSANLPSESAENFDAVFVPLPALLLTYLKIGTISIGGRSASYLLDELAYRRKWLRQDDWLEGLTLGRILPGPTVLTVAVYLANMLRGPSAAALCLVFFTVPGLLIALVLTCFVFGVPREPWANGALAALAASAFGMFVFTSLRTLPSCRKVRFGPFFVAITALMQVLLGFDLVLTFIIVGTCSVWMNRPGVKGKKQEARG